MACSCLANSCPICTHSRHPFFANKFQSFARTKHLLIKNVTVKYFQKSVFSLGQLFVQVLRAGLLHTLKTELSYMYVRKRQLC